MFISQIRESGIGMAFSTFAVNVIVCEEFTIFDVLPSMESVILDANTKNSIFAVSETRPALSLATSLITWLPSRSPVWFLLQLFAVK